MARRRRIIGGDDEDGDYAAFLASRQPQQDPMAMAMKLLNFAQGQQTDAQKQALDERQQAAWRSIRRDSWALNS